MSLWKFKFVTQNSCQPLDFTIGKSDARAGHAYVTKCDSSELVRLAKVLFDNDFNLILVALLKLADALVASN